MSEHDEQDEMADLLDGLGDDSSDESPAEGDDTSAEPGAKKKASKKASKKTTSTPPPAPKEPKGHVIAPGKALSCGPRGLLTAGDSISAADFSDGEEGLKALIGTGHIVAK